MRASSRTTPDRLAHLGHVEAVAGANLKADFALALPLGPRIRQHVSSCSRRGWRAGFLVMRSSHVLTSAFAPDSGAWAMLKQDWPLGVRVVPSSNLSALNGRIAVPESMPKSPVSLNCPHCGHPQAFIAVLSQTILTVTCSACEYSWSAEISSIPESVQRATETAALERNQRTH